MTSIRISKIFLEKVEKVQLNLSNGKTSNNRLQNKSTVSRYVLLIPISLPNIKMCISFDKLTSPAGTHRPVSMSIFSMTYPVISEPPLSSGWVHWTVMWLARTSIGSKGPTGLDGLSVKRYNTLRINWTLLVMVHGWGTTTRVD